MAILGLITAESYASERPKSIRRKVFHFFPQGAAPLTGLLSLLKEETADDPEFKWWEDRYEERKSITAAISTTIAFYKTVVLSTATWTIADANLTPVVATSSAATIYGIKVADATQFRPGAVIKFVATLASGTGEFQGIIEPGGVDSANSRIAFRATMSGGAIDYDLAANVGIEVIVIGSAYSEGSTDISSEATIIPKLLYNHTQIFRTPFSMTGTAAKTALWYDKSGPYKEKAKKHSVDHMTDLERNFIFGERTLYTGAASGLPTRTTGGILFFLRQFELTSNNPYGGSGATAGDNASDNKRIIDFNDYSVQAGEMTVARMNVLLARLFRVTNSTVNEKLVLCGNGFLSNVNQLYFGSAALNTNLPMTDTFGMDVVSHRTPFGTIHYKTHPLFTLNPTLNYNALCVDVHNLNYTYLEGRDTALLKNRQANDADYRKDEWLSECGLEVHFPESCMYMKNVTSFG